MTYLLKDNMESPPNNFITLLIPSTSRTENILSLISPDYGDVAFNNSLPTNYLTSFFTRTGNVLSLISTDYKDLAFNNSSSTDYLTSFSTAESTI